MARLVDSTKIQDGYAAALPASRALYERARRLFPDAVTHDNRRMQPFPLYVDRAEGAYKWDVDGHRYVDYWMGHGALLLGHNPPRGRGRRARAGAPRHPLRRLPPEGGRVGRVGVAGWCRARSACASPRPAPRPRTWPCAWPGPSRASGTSSSSRVTSTAGTRASRSACARPTRPSPRRASFAEVVDLVTVLPPNDIAAVRERLAAGDVAAVIIEPTGGHFGVGARAPVVPLGPARGDAARGRAADLRRGRHRLPRGAGRRPGEARRDARPDHARQDPGRRAARRRLSSGART